MNAVARPAAMMTLRMMMLSDRDLQTLIGSSTRCQPKDWHPCCCHLEVATVPTYCLLRIRSAEHVHRTRLVAAGALDVPAGRLGAGHLRTVLDHVLGRVHVAAATRGDLTSGAGHIGAGRAADRGLHDGHVGRTRRTDRTRNRAVGTRLAVLALGTGDSAVVTLDTLVTLRSLVTLVALLTLQRSDEDVTVTSVTSVEPDLIGIVTLGTVGTLRTLRASGTLGTFVTLSAVLAI